LKAFHWNCKTKGITDVTDGNRLSLTDASDPGGRLGPFLNEGTPDLRNLDLYFQPCNEGDIIFLVSDGVHDNLDPQVFKSCFFLFLLSIFS
jgi:serine/threonine protein phosphatase PrpC